MIGIDTNLLARYYIQDESDSKAEKQHLSARKLIESGQPLMVCKTVILELEWVLRGYYRFNKEDCATVLQHLLSLPNITIEDRLSVERALTNLKSGIEFADALHHASYRDCKHIASFDDKKFARRVHRLGLVPRVIVPK
jgi:predicted nucleic-acid-binding protein